MSYTFVAISSYIFMRAFETAFAEEKQKPWFKRTLRGIAFALLYIAFSALAVCYDRSIWFLGFNPSM